MVRYSSWSTLFKPQPDQWGLRGDPFLWRAMERVLSKIPLPPTEDQLIALIEASFEKLTGSVLPTEKFISDAEFDLRETLCAWRDVQRTHIAPILALHGNTAPAFSLQNAVSIITQQR